MYTDVCMCIGYGHPCGNFCYRDVDVAVEPRLVCQSANMCGDMRMQMCAICTFKSSLDDNTPCLDGETNVVDGHLRLDMHLRLCKCVYKRV